MTTRRVVQWTTGNVGRRGIRAVVASPDLELVGCYVTAEGGKAGRDAGELAGIDPIGVVATDDADAILALDADCVVYAPKWPSVDDLETLLANGSNVVATAAFVTGHGFGEEARHRLIAACEAGGTSLFGSGMNPGMANLLGLVATGICASVDKVSVLESVDSTGYDSPETEKPCGFGQPIDDPDLPEMTRAGTAVFADVVHLTADGLGVDLDDVVFAAEYAQTTKPLDLGSWTIDAGCVAGVAATWQGVVDGEVVIDLGVRWRKGATLEPDWHIEHGYLVEVVGSPSARMRYEILPPPDFAGTTMDDFMVLGMDATVMPAVHAIGAVCDAAPGIVTYIDLPLITARGARSRA